MIDSFFFISFFSNVNAFDLNKLFCPNLVLILQSETSWFGCKGGYYILYAYSPSRLRSLFGYWVSRWIVFMKTFRSENQSWKYHEFCSKLWGNIRCWLLQNLSFIKLLPYKQYRNSDMGRYCKPEFSPTKNKERKDSEIDRILIMISKCLAMNVENGVTMAGSLFIKANWKQLGR